MPDRPILFSAPMVRALLAGTKTQTRRVLKPQPETFQLESGDDCLVYLVHAEGESVPRVAMGDGRCGVITLQKVPFAGGDRLWVKETWRTHRIWDADKPSYLIHGSRVWYEADERDNCDQHGKTRVSIFMPRWASRLTLTVTDVRIERLQDISTADVLAEGAALDPYHRDGTQDGSNPYMCVGDRPHTSQSPRAWYHRLWDSINGAGAWDANPWVVAVSFDVRKGNIDA
ncbi:hypothetical protein [Microcystis phage Mae-JY04]|uniref:hypothetical protein n=1 Tax=Blastomonas sp. TaxID=1909299 RepID=UPI00258800A2|nr:hypothetical protein [Blastomonas sp.]